MLYLIIYLKLFRIIFAETKYILPYDVEISSDIDSIINWRYKSDYYYPNLNGKINQIFDKKCREKPLIIYNHHSSSRFVFFCRRVVWRVACGVWRSVSVLIKNDFMYIFARIFCKLTGEKIDGGDSIFSFVVALDNLSYFSD